MKKIAKWLLCILGILAFIFLFGYAFEANRNQYLVRITYCDSRPPVEIVTKALGEPNNSDISSYKEATTRYRGHLNVCDIKTLKKLD